MKVIIIGKGPGWKDAPMEGETWGVNDLLLRRPVKLTFEIHNIDEKYKRNRTVALNRRGIFRKEIRKIKLTGTPVITGMKHRFFPGAIIFPFNEMPSDYFTCSIAYMIAYAIYKGATEIEMYGVALLKEKEYAWERPCIEFWIGYAMGKGIKVAVHEPTKIECFKHHKLYGRDK